MNRSDATRSAGPRTVAVLLSVVLVSSVLTGVVAAATPEEQVIGRPDLDVSAPDNRLAPSERGSLTVVLSNGGEVRQGGPAALTERVTTARNVRVSVLESRVDAPIEFKSGDVVLGSVGTDRPATATFEVETGEALQPGTYRIPIRLSYDYTRLVTYEPTQSPPGYGNPDFSDSFRERVVSVDVVVDSEPRFRVESDGAENLFAGDTGSVTMTVTNAGWQTARDATVELSSKSPSVYFGPQSNPQPSATTFVAELAPGASTTATFEVGATSETTPGTYPIEARVTYENDNGVRTVSDPLSTEVTVGAERRFSVENLQTERLRVGEDDVVVTGDVVNHGPAPATNAVVRLAVGSSGSVLGDSPGGAGGQARGAGAPASSGGPGPVVVTSAESSVGTLAPGESRPVTFRLAVSEDAEPGSQTLRFLVEYENADGDLRRSTTPVRRSVEVGPERDAFAVVGVETSVRAGGSATLRVTVENTGDSPVTDANAKLFVNDPLSAPDNGAFVGRLEPGERTTLTFGVAAADSARAKAYAGSVEIRYEDQDGDTALADDLRIGVPVSPSSGGLPLTYVGFGLGVAVLAGGVYIWRRD
ncbi:COG1361 S-layer family protein [Salinigranum rubrum]|uniref:COG1361 S-layer family protein n=1 Tax=Salinigranum rubrum TaxID=755307 RepID=UPI0013A534FF|nr:COG1361 S-layer family protein [Salinigranum rubrum]